MSVNALKVCKPGYLGPANLMVITLDDHEAEVARLKAENESLRADAERYRWIRGNGGGQDFVCLSTRGEEMDEAVDKKLNHSPENPS